MRKPLHRKPGRGTFTDERPEFTPIFDDVAREVGCFAAIVHGAVWYYCEQSHGVCGASSRKIAWLVRIHPATVLRHLKALVRAGYLEDLTPAARKAAHIYRDTGKGAGDATWETMLADVRSAR